MFFLYKWLVSEVLKNFLGFIGYAKDVYEIVSYIPVADTADDQLYYTNIFLDPALRVITFLNALMFANIY